jgi:hypothetical protein
MLYQVRANNKGRRKVYCPKFKKLIEFGTACVECYHYGGIDKKDKIDCDFNYGK